jgi:hypothetical protein
MNESTPLGTGVEFTSAVEFEDGETVVFTPSRPGKAEVIQIGWLYYEASEPEQDAMLDDLGPVLVRRSLRVFANYAARTGQREVAEYAALLRDEIKVLRDDETEATA